MKTFFKIIFSPILIPWWILTRIIRILAHLFTIALPNTTGVIRDIFGR
jgi:hypothetical protein